MFLAIVVLVFYFLRLTKHGKSLPIRSIAAIEAIPDAVGRAAEMGRPVTYNPGDMSGLTTTYAPQTIAGFAGLQYTARVCARTGAGLICWVSRTELITYAQDVISSAYASEGKSELYSSDMVQYITSSLEGGLSQMMLWNPATCIVIGSCSTANCHFYVGSTELENPPMWIGGTARLPFAGFFACIMDYLILAEEIFAVGAKLGKDPVSIATINATDILKIFIVGVIVVGIIATLAGSTIIQTIFNF